MKNTIFIIDGSSYIFRAYYATPQLFSANGNPINAVCGFLSMLQKLIKNYSPRYLLLAFDTGFKNFRHLIFPDYKCNRILTPIDLSTQFSLIYKMLDAFEICRFSRIGFEADDIIGTIACRVNKMGFPAIIVTSDKDMMQLISDQTFILNQSSASNLLYKLIRPEVVKSQFGVVPSKIPDLLGLAGDRSDNIPGVFGIGIKTAARLINTYESIENLLKHARNIPEGSLQKKIIKDSKLAIMSKKLATINCNVGLTFSLPSLQNNKITQNKILEMYTQIFRNN